MRYHFPGVRRRQEIIYVYPVSYSEANLLSIIYCSWRNAKAVYMFNIKWQNFVRCGKCSLFSSRVMHVHSSIQHFAAWLASHALLIQRNSTCCVSISSV